MIAPALLLALWAEEPSLSTLNSLAAKKDVKALALYSNGDGREFRVLRGGAYEVGRMGWKVVALEPKFSDRRFVVFTTPLTSEDIGELVFERVGSKLKYIPEYQVEPIRLRHHKLDLRFDSLKKQVSILDQIDVENREKVEGDVATLRFSPCYQVSSITDGDKPVEWIQSGGTVMLKRPTAKNSKLFVTYKGTVNLPKYAGSILDDNVTLTNDYWYPLVNRLPATYEITVHHPSDWEVVAQGNYSDAKPDKGLVATTYRMDLPAVYWSLTVGKVKHHQEKIGELTHHVWSTNLPEAKMRLQPRINAHILDSYSKWFGAYPFGQWGTLDSPTYGGGALEAYSFATYGEGWMPAIDPHEPAHTWFGGILPNSYLRSFWNEGFAVWCEGLYERECALGSNEDRRAAFVKIPNASEAYNAAPLMASGVEIGAAASELGYGKSGDVLSMLEQLIGTKNLTEAVKDWVRVHPKGELAEWEEFEQIVTRKYPQFELKSFFDDWFRRPGFANVELVSGQFSGGKFEGTLRWNGPKFRMPLDLWFENKGGVRQRVMLDTKNADASSKFEVVIPGFTPSKVYLDPYHRALRSGAGPRLLGYGDAAGRMKVYRDPSRADWMKVYESSTTDLSDVAGKLIVGHPDSTPAMKPLLVKAGFAVNGNNLTFRGTTIDLTKAGAVAVIELEGGKRCAIALGKCELEPNVGRAHTALVDDLGRMLRGSTGFPSGATFLTL